MTNINEKYTTCPECEAEFFVQHDNVGDPEYCPFCSAVLIDDIEEDYDDEDY
jgi:Zn-finger nucleic acid-binding protein